MALTIKVILDDNDVQHFIDLYNQDAGTKITADMVNQNSELQEAISSDMLQFWFEALEYRDEDNDHASAFDLYSDFTNDILVLPGDPVFNFNNEDIEELEND